MNIVFFVLLLFGPAPCYEVVDSIVFKHNDETLETCAFMQEKILDAFHRGEFHNPNITRVEVTPCTLITMDTKL